MDRRDFIRSVAAAGAAGVSVEAATDRATTTVKYAVDGFTCVTCAVGLETMLKGRAGVARVSASYPKRSVTIAYDSRMTDESALAAFISDCGFTVRRA